MSPKNKIKKNFFLILPDISIVLSMSFLVIFIFISYFAIFGILKFNYQTEPVSVSPYILFHWPEHTTKTICENNNCYREIPTKKTYLTLNLPRYFHEVEMEIIYRQTTEQPLTIEVVGDNQENNIKTIENPSLDKLLNENQDQTISRQGIKLVQKNKLFQSLENFITNIPPGSKVGTYGINIAHLLSPKKLANQEIELFTAGNLEIQFTALKSNSNITFNFSQIFPTAGQSVFEIFLFDKYDNLIYKEALTPPKFTGNPTDFFFTLPDLDLPSGEYVLNLKAENELITKKVNTTFANTVFHSPITFASRQQINSFWPEVKISDLSVYTSAKKINLFRQNTCQTTTNENITQIICPNRDLTITGDYQFALSEENLWDHNITLLTPNDSQSLEDFDFILTDYEPPQQLENNWKKQIIKLSLSPENYFKNKINLSFSFPGEQKENGSFQIKNIGFSLYANPITHKHVISMLNNYFSPNALAAGAPLTY